MRDVDHEALRTAFGSYMTGVTVVTAVAECGAPVGFTANSFTSVSLEPPLLLVCPARRLSSFGVFQTCGHFAVNVLADDQRDVSNVFARRVGDRFAEVAWHRDAWGCPLLAGVSASFSCAVHQRVAAGDHVVLIGRVEAFDASARPGLGFAAGAYFSRMLEHGVRAGTAPASTRSACRGVRNSLSGS